MSHSLLLSSASYSYCCCYSFCTCAMLGQRDLIIYPSIRTVVCAFLRWWWENWETRRASFCTFVCRIYDIWAIYNDSNNHYDVNDELYLTPAELSRIAYHKYIDDVIPASCLEIRVYILAVRGHTVIAWRASFLFLLLFAYISSYHCRPTITLVLSCFNY